MKTLLPTALDVSVPQAPVARMRALEQAVARTGGHEVVVLPLGPGGPTRSGRTSRLGRALAGVQWRLRAVRTVRERLRSEGVDAVLLVDIDPLFLWLVSHACRSGRVPMFLEVTEVPEEVLGGGLLGRLRVALYWATVRRARGVLAISQYLQRAVQAESRTPVLVVPGYVDVHEFPVGVDEPAIPTVMYAGSLSETKDGVRALIEAFAQAVTATGGVARLRILSAGFSEPELESVNEVISGVAGEAMISVEGPYPRSEIPRLLSEATLLALPRPASRQAEGGFPTKLGEYLASGRPVVATRVGALQDVLHDDVDAVLVDPGEHGQLVEALRELLSSPEKRRRIGLAGRQVAERVLNVDAHAGRVMTFFEEETRHG